VDTADLARVAVMALLFGAYFALWAHARTGGPSGPRRRAGRAGGVLGAFTGALGLSTGPCSVLGCGAPVLPVIGLAFAGLSSGTLAFLSTLSRVASQALLALLIVAVGYLGWRTGGEAVASGRPRS
jgi:hypothetical protein